jgi:hypothetical protein
LLYEVSEPHAPLATFEKVRGRCNAPRKLRIIAGASLYRSLAALNALVQVQYGTQSKLDWLFPLCREKVLDVAIQPL